MSRSDSEQTALAWLDQFAAITCAMRAIVRSVESTDQIWRRAAELHTLWGNALSLCGLPSTRYLLDLLQELRLITDGEAARTYMLLDAISAHEAALRAEIARRATAEAS